MIIYLLYLPRTDWGDHFKQLGQMAWNVAAKIIVYHFQDLPLTFYFALPVSGVEIIILVM